MRLLDRYILGDMLRVIGLTTAVLVSVVAFGATIKPLANEAFLSAGQTLKYMMLAIVPMLQFALPFAAGFGATLSFHRLTSDNEILAMAAGGISYRRILMPVVGFGMALTLLMIVLTQWVIPQFWTLIERTLATDVTALFQATIERGETFEMDDWQIYADRIIPAEVSATDGGPQTRLVLVGVAAAELDEHGRVLQDVTANQAVLDVYRSAGQTYLKLLMTDTVAYEASSGRLAAVPVAEPRVMMLPSRLRDEPKAMTRGQLLALRENPDAFGQVIEHRILLARAVREIAVRQAIDARLREQGSVSFALHDATGRQSQGTVTVRAVRLRETKFVSREHRPLLIEIQQPDRPGVTITSPSAVLSAAPAIDPAELFFELVIEEPTVLDEAGRGIPRQRRIVLTGLSPEGHAMPEVLEWPSARLLDYVASSEQRHEGHMFALVGELQRELQALFREITSRLLNRYALSVTALLLLLLGTTLAMWLRGSLPLTIYLWAFLPAVLDLILISAGEQLMRDGRALGPLLMWSGNVMLLLIIALAYFKLSRN